MENFMCSNWPELGNWILCEEANKRDFSSLFPMPLSAESSGFASCSVPRGEVREEDGPSDASTVYKSHSLAEKRRRDRISVQLSCLRILSPTLIRFFSISFLFAVDVPGCFKSYRLLSLSNWNRKAKYSSETSPSSIMVSPLTTDRVHMCCMYLNLNGFTLALSHCYTDTRIIAKLRNIYTFNDQMDKASLLGSVVQQVKYLKREAKEVSKVLTVPSDFDEVIIDCFLNKDESSTSNFNTTEKIYIRASICCEDRPNLFPELSQVFKNLGLQITRAEMACSGGRINSVTILSPQNGKEDVFISNAVQSLKVMLGRIALFSNQSRFLDN